MIERLLRSITAPVTDVVSVGLLRLGDALRVRWRAHRPVRGDGAHSGIRDDGSGSAGARDDGERSTEDLVVEVVVTTAALALAPLVAGAIVRAIARRAAGRRH